MRRELRGRQALSDVVFTMGIACDERRVGGYYENEEPAAIARSCPFFVSDNEDFLENFFVTWPRSLDTESGIEEIYITGTYACKGFDVDARKKPKFYMNGIEQDSNMIKMSWGDKDDDKQLAEAPIITIM